MGPPLIGTMARVVTLRGSLTIILVLLAILALAGRRALAAHDAPQEDGSRRRSIQ